MEIMEELSRRSFVSAGVGVVAALILSGPVTAVAATTELRSGNEVRSNLNMSVTEFDRYIDDCVRVEGNAYIESLMAKDAEAGVPLSSRPTYENVYEAAQYRAVDEALRRLRAKLSGCGGAVAIESLWGRGVRLVVAS